MNRRSAWAILAGFLVAVVVTTLIDVVLHVVGVFPPLKEPLTDGLALVASSYLIVIGIACAWLTARRAPWNPMRHAMILGGLGAVVALVGVVATWNLGLGPRWYPISLVLLALPQSWVGGRLFERQTNGSPSHAEGRPSERG
jgi:hypothetical protein